MYIYLTDSAGNTNCCYVPDAVWPSVRGAMNTAARANGMTFIAQTIANNPNDVKATCADAASAQAWVNGLSVTPSIGGEFEDLEREFKGDITSPAVVGFGIGGAVVGALAGGLWPAVVLGAVGAGLGNWLFGKKVKT